MKKLILVFACLCALHATAFSQKVFAEDFLFGPIGNLDNVNGWFITGIDFPYDIKVVAPGLTYKDYVGSARGNTCQLANAGNGDVVLRHLDTAITAGAAYMSLMIQVDSLPSTVTEGYCISFNPNTGGTNLNTSLYIKRLSDSTFNLGVQKEIENTISYASNTFERGKTYLVVLKYSIVDGAGNDASSLYVFTQGVPATEPAMPAAGTNDGDDYTGQASVVLNNNYAQTGITGCNIKLDGIRVGTSWATSVLDVLSSVSGKQTRESVAHSNSPNPFSQKTAIHYQIPAKGLVQIDVLDASGRLVAGLLHEKQETGAHTMHWDASSLPPGLYFYRIYFNGAVFSGQMFRQ
ncbi:T9SS type A sorting domain-containing protein [Haliscomenobacter hydrossis]|uniref:Secretion system C-terminal sorting domain-containing protein n=1 Tax=Haliscomenobacter hydrossis (strain ATCC 27775 / DSM 1100 / LMG 10767 / O) TaxID=760192 RepID=F4L706_HALH1|nr:T9SS type A sorting domain-containing protein [Haliscomenobacter hydrossis]AEE51961.1 hypothetical protein Halhy_4115 [Haliscomenobacter hydrossis DSM 1100]